MRNSYHFTYFYAKVYNAENNDNTRVNLKKSRSKENLQDEINDKKNLDCMRNMDKDDNLVEKDVFRDDRKEENSVKKEKHVCKIIEVYRFIVYHISCFGLYIHLRRLYHIMSSYHISGRRRFKKINIIEGRRHGVVYAWKAKTQTKEVQKTHHSLPRS